jgi:uncharacterized membrane protein YagU involved in acid resistance
MDDLTENRGKVGQRWPATMPTMMQVSRDTKEVSSMASAQGRTQLDTGWAVKHGIIAGIIAGIVFLLAEMMGARFIGGDPFIMPLKAIASVPIGDPPPQIATGTAIPVGLITHAINSAIFGIIFALIAAKVPALHRSPMMLVIAASVYGTILWVVNFYMIAPLLGRPWFTETPPVQQFVYHTFFYGTVLGLYLRSVMPAMR